MPPKTTMPCPCGSGRAAVFACAGHRWCIECVDGTDARPSQAEVYASPEAQAMRDSHNDRPRAERETPAVTEPTAPPEGFEYQRSVNGGVTTVRAPRARQMRAPSPASVSYVRSLLAEREGVTEAEAIRTVLNEARANGNLDQSLVSSCIDALKKIAKPRRSEPGVPRRTDGYEPKHGDVHVIDGTYYRVHESRDHGFLYGAVWNEDEAKFLGPRHDDRAKGLLRRISAATVATAEQAAAFGHMTERCCFCSTPIRTPESTAVGYGPDCADKHGLPWG